MPNIQHMLDELEADIAAGEVQLVRQRELIADLEMRGQNPAFAKSIVKELKAIQAKQVALRDKLRAEVIRRAWLDQDLRAAESRPSSERT
ncbi:hypothetical protein [Chelatococcus reniformis]|uniref:Uncharacterized protein n=1 Tax=Chelatococcus reniformis TaxID=1494448 RepID=A0A916XP74_9HYPH|nr:hypothetical protein [Chelatococcus reniformis]GGC88612.1 hypothetical protein GCM10010994_53150 [Chelatococcus reniformis]